MCRQAGNPYCEAGMTILEALQQVVREMELTYEHAFAKAGKSPTRIAAKDFNAHRIDLEAIARRLASVEGDANRDLTIG
jgi:hypothetical protein